MPLATWFRSLHARLDSNYPSRGISRPKSRRPTTIRLCTERLEYRLNLAGFGPEDGSYIVEPWNGKYVDVDIQPGDQKIVATGGNTTIARKDSAGNPDASFGTAGLSVLSIPGAGGSSGGLVLQPDGKAVVSTSFPSSTGGLIGAYRVNSNGSLDTTFGAGGWNVLYPRPNYGQVAAAIGLQSSGQIVVGGHGVQYSDYYLDAAMLGAFKSNGALNSGKGGFGDVLQGKPAGSTMSKFGGMSANFDSLVVQPDNKIVGVGTFSATRNTHFGGQLLVARYTDKGVIDRTFNGSGYAVLTLPGIIETSTVGTGTNRVALQSDGKIVVASNAWALDDELDMLVTRFNANGTLDTTFGGGAGYVRLDVDGSASSTGESGECLVLQPDGKIVAGGALSKVGEPSRVFVVRLNTNGALDSSFGAGGFKLGGLGATPGQNFDPNGIALQSDSSIIVAGYSYSDLSTTKPFLMRFLGDSPPVQLNTRFYVVDDAASDRTYEYASSGPPVEDYALASGNTAPRGAASTAAGDKVWVVDANQNVYVYGNSGGLFGSWTAGTLASNSTVEGIATGGTDIWIVDAESDNVFRYSGAASRLSGSQTAVSSFSLNGGNTNPKDIVTNGTYLWVMNDSSTDMVFKYTLSGTLVGSWTISTSGASSPTGITLDPANPGALWIVDSGTARVYQYDNALAVTSGSLAASTSFALSTGNTNPQGIADPPPPALPLADVSRLGCPDMRIANSGGATLGSGTSEVSHNVELQAALVDQIFTPANDQQANAALSLWLAEELESTCPSPRRRWQ